jgi:hypothetical protein
MKLCWSLCTGPFKSASGLSQELDLPFSTTWEWLQRLRIVIEEQMQNEQFELIDPELLLSVFFRRSLESPAKAGPESSFESSKEHPPGQSIESSDQSNPKTLLAMSILKFFISEGLHGISRKYGQIYAAQLGFTLLKTDQPLAAAASIIKHPTVSRKQILAYQSTDFIWLPERAISEDAMALVRSYWKNAIGGRRRC